MKVAIVTDPLYTLGGCERVLEDLQSIFNCTIHTTFVTKEFRAKKPHWKIQTPFLFKLWPFKNSPKLVMLVLPALVKNINVGKVDVVISVTSSLAKGVRVPRGALHICYMLTPPRFLYGFAREMNLRDHLILRIPLKLYDIFLKYLDQKWTKNPDKIVAISKTIQERIENVYNIQSEVLYSGTPVKSLNTTIDRKDYVLCVSRLASYKHVDLAILACHNLGIPLKIVGEGREKEALEILAEEKNVTFMGFVDNQLLDKLYSEALCTIYLAEDEDLGLVPIESMAHGTPLVVPYLGGFRETVLEGETGIFTNSFAISDIEKAIKSCIQRQWDRENLHTQALKYSSEEFQKNFKTLIEKETSHNARIT